MRYVSMDGEFSGLDHTKHELISVGFCDCEDLSNNFYAEIKATKPMDPKATKIHGLSWDHLQEKGVDRVVAARMLYNWLMSMRPKTGYLVFVGYPVVLDWIFLDQLFKEAKLPMLFHYEQLDIHTLGVALLGLSPGFAEVELRELLKLPPVDVHEKHNALYDAKIQAEEFNALMSLRGSGR